MSSQRNNNNRARRGKPRKAPKRRNNNKMVMGKRLPQVLPDVFPAEHSIIYDRTLTNTTGAQRFNPNALFQPEVSGGTPGTVVGYSFYSAGYDFYRVLDYRYTIEFMNKEAFNIAVFVINNNEDPSTGASVTAAANPLSQRKNVSAKGGMDRARLSKKLTIERVVGSKAALFADSYRALNNASPADPTWLAIGASSFSGSTLTLGVDYQLTLTMTALWTSRKTIT